MKLRCSIFAAVCAVSLTMAAQETAPTPLKLDAGKSSVQPLPDVPVTPTWSTPALAPDFQSLSLPSRLNLTPQSLSDSIAAYSFAASAGQIMPGKPHYDFSMDPYSRNWMRSGVMAMPGGGYLVGSGSYSAMPALGNVGQATLQWVQPLGERLTVAVGAGGTKYHFDRRAWNDYSVFAKARFALSDRFALKAWGSYYIHPLYHSMAAMPYVGSSNYGASLDTKFTDLLGLELGAQRYMDPLTGRWRTVPVIAPSVNLGGQVLSIDLGGLVKSLFDSSKDTFDPMKSYDPRSTGTNVNMPAPPGFNPHSPVRIPDALRR